MNHSKIVVVALVVAVVGAATTLPAEARKKKPKKVERIIEVTYEVPAIGSPGVGGATTLPTLPTALNEIYMSVEQTDAVSPLPFVRLAWDTNGDGDADNGITVCGGKPEGPIIMPGGVEIRIFPYLAPGPECMTGFNTTGTIQFTFSNLP